MELWKRNLYACWTAQMLAMVGFGIFFPFLPLAVQELGVANKEEAALVTGVMGTVAFIVMALLSPIWGALGDRFGRKSMLTRAMIGGFIICGLMFFATEVWQLFILRVVQGAFTGTVPAAVALVASLTPQKRMGYSLGLMQTAVYSGQTIGPLVGGVLGDLVGHKILFAIGSILLGAAGLVVIFIVKEDFTPPVREAGKSAFRNFMDGITYTLRRKEVLGMAIVLAFIQFTNTVIQPILPFFVQKLGTLGKDVGVSTTIGVIAGITGVVSAFSAFFIGRLSDNWGHKRVLIICAVAAFALYIPQALAGNSWQLLILRAGMGVFIGGILPLANAIIGRLTPAGKRGATYGLVNSIGSIGLATGPLTGAVLANAFDVRLVFAVTAFTMLIIAATAWQVMRHSTAVPVEDAPRESVRV